MLTFSVAISVQLFVPNEGQREASVSCDLFLPLHYFVASADPLRVLATPILLLEDTLPQIKL